ncbi:MAG TPA: site-specific integrase [Candidatus Polarisedimenticolia bacterium]|nr:site-specific integrase [Candidatus Polarisedimenticolia bacterium]
MPTDPPRILEALNALREEVARLRQEVAAGRAGQEQLTLREALDRWLAFGGKIWEHDTLLSVTTMTRRWKRLGNLRMQEVRPLDIQGLYEERDDGTLAAATVNLDRKYLRAFWKWALARQLAENDPTAAWPIKRGPGKRVYIQIPREDQEAIERCLKLRFRRWLRFVFATGLRSGESRKIRWSWISAEDVLEIPAAVRKQRRAHRMPLPRKIVEDLGPRGGDEDLAFPNVPRSRQSLAKVLKRAARKAGLPYWRAVTPHSLRRSWYGRIRRAGVPQEAVQNIGGWKSRSVMETYYWSPIGDKEARAYLERI